MRERSMNEINTPSSLGPINEFNCLREKMNSIEKFDSDQNARKGEREEEFLYLKIDCIST